MRKIVKPTCVGATDKNCTMSVADNSNANVCRKC
jgi:hypothetical protein